MKLYILFISFLYPSFAKGQERKLFFVDKNKEVIAFATVKVIHTKVGKIASAKGEVIISFSNLDTLLISSVGHLDTLLLGKDVLDTVILASRIKVLDDVTVRSNKPVKNILLGNGADLIEKNIRCNPSSGMNENCILWSYGAGAEFAEQISLPDSQKTYRLSKVYLPLKKSECWQPIYFQIYEIDSIRGNPGKLIFRKYLSLDSEVYSKGKIVLNMQSEHIYFTNQKGFFVSVSWNNESTQNTCLTILPLLKSPVGISYNRSLQSPDYHWFIFNGNTAISQKDGRYRTAFAVELEEIKNL